MQYSEVIAHGDSKGKGINENLTSFEAFPGCS